MAITRQQIGVWLAEAREKASLSQAAAGRAIGKDSQQISKWERAVSDMAASSFLELLQLYGGKNVLVELSRMLGVSPAPLGVEPVRAVAEPDPAPYDVKPLPAGAIGRQVAAAEKSAKKKSGPG